MPFKGHKGDRITLIKRENSSGIAYIVETGRQRASNIISVQSRTYNVSRGESGLTFNNNYSSDTVEFVLPMNHLADDEPIFTFVKESSQVLIISAGSRAIPGASLGSSSVELKSGSVTFQADSLFYRPIAQTGIYVHLNPSVAGYERGILAGIPYTQIADSLGLSPYTSGDRIAYTTAGNTKLSNNADFTYNATAGANSRYGRMQNGSFAGLEWGIGHSVFGSNRSTITGFSDETFSSTRPALGVYGIVHGGTFSSKTNITDGDAQLNSFYGYGWRNGSARAAAGILLQGANASSTNGYAASIGFNTSDGTTFARRATVHRNGDFYIGNGLPTVEPEATSSKLLIRGDGTGTGNALLIEDSGGTDRLIVKDNGIINASSLPTYADDTAAGSGGLVAGDLYRTSTGELRIKL
jgi:hypothetical protein